MIDWAEIAKVFWGTRFEIERLEGLRSKDFKIRYSWRNMSPFSYPYFRDADCKNAAERIANLAHGLKEAGMVAMIEKRAVCRTRR